MAFSLVIAFDGEWQLLFKAGALVRAGFQLELAARSDRIDPRYETVSAAFDLNRRHQTGGTSSKSV